jgi:hypothetical protein
MVFILSKNSRVYKRMPTWVKQDVNRGIIGQMSLGDYQEALEEIWGKDSTIPKAQIERDKWLHRNSIIAHRSISFSVAEY